jgi:hypothetical protein
VASRNREHESLEPATSEVCGQLRFRAARGPLASAAELNRKGANVNPLIKRLALALLVASVAAVSANAAGAAGDRHAAKVRSRGPRTRRRSSRRERLQRTPSRSRSRGVKARARIVSTQPTRAETARCGVAPAACDAADSRSQREGRRRC